MNPVHEPSRHEEAARAERDAQNDARGDGAPGDGAAAEETATPDVPTDDDAADDDPAADDPAADDPAAEARLYLERLQRVQAEFENFRRRSREEMRDKHQRVVGEVFRHVLPVVDDLRMAARTEEAADGGVSEGLRIILDKVRTILDQFSIEEIAAVGEPFDPRWHEAMIHQESADVEPGHVLEELERGYRLGESLVRPSRVIVAKAPEGATEGPDDADV